jgi:FixJ family two-component response regulator
VIVLTHGSESKDEGRMQERSGAVHIGIVHIVVQDEPLRRALAQIVASANLPVRQYAHAGEFLIAFLSRPGGCVFIDTKLRGPSGLELQAALAAHDDGPPTVVFGEQGDVESAVLSMRQGGVDYITNPSDRERVLAAAHEALAQYEARKQRDDDACALRRKFDTLTSRERSVVERVVAGQRNKQIGAALSICDRTVKAHRASAMQKLELSNVQQLVRAGMMLGFREGSKIPATIGAFPRGDGKPQFFAMEESK